MMKLYYKNEHLGDITSYGQDEGVWFVGNILLNENAEEYKAFFTSLTDENNEINKNNNFPNAWLDENNWFILNASKNKRNIDLPAIYLNDNSIYWRWL